jgi:hypothetical protein
VNIDYWFYLCFSPFLIFLSVAAQLTGMMKDKVDMNLLCSCFYGIAVMEATVLCSTAGYSNDNRINLGLAGCCMIAFSAYVGVYINSTITIQEKDAEYGKQK